MKKITVLFITLVYFSLIIAQENREIELSKHVHFLSDDKLEGRGTGSEGEKIAQSYIASYFVEYGIKPLGENGFIQPFNFTLGKKW